jgi:hypothetical protein
MQQRDSSDIYIVTYTASAAYQLYGSDRGNPDGLRIAVLDYL